MGQQSPPAAPMLHQTRRRRWLRALGVLIACAAGFVAYGVLPEGIIYFQLTVGVACLVSTLLWRTGWAVLVVPAAVWVGAVAPEVEYLVFAHYPFNAVAIIAALDVLALMFLPAMVGAVVGTLVGMWLERQSSK